MMLSSWSVCFVSFSLVFLFLCFTCVQQVNFAPYFVAPPGKATVQVVADHVEHIAKVAGKRQ